MAKKNQKTSSFERALKRAIARTIREDLVLFDTNIPEALRVSPPKEETPIVRKEHVQKLSPFILELRQSIPSPESIMEDSDTDIRLNFLDGALTQMNDFDSWIEDTSGDLVVSDEELSGQLDQVRYLSPAGRLSVPKKPLRSWFMPARQSIQWTPLRIQKQKMFSASTFEPKPLPENILSYFDLPEEESAPQDTEELVDLADLFDVENVPETVEIPKKSWLPSFSFIAMPNGWQRTIVSFVLLSFVFVLPLHAMQTINHLRDAKTHAQANGLQALQDLKNVSGANLVTNPQEAGEQFQQAGAAFGRAQENIADMGAGVTLLLSTLTPTQKTFKTNTALVKIGSELSLAGERISDGFAAMKEEISPTPSSRVALLEMYLDAALPHLQAAEDALKDVDINQVEASHRDAIEKLTATLPPLVRSAQEFLSLSDALQSILGSNGTKHYLLVFQNNMEMRATGGFMGSYAEMTVHNGIMEKLDIPGGGTYDLQGQQKKSYVSPWPLQLLSAKWEFQDANWFPDFRDSARHIIQLYKNARSSDVDGVIAINATFIQDLIGLLGPIDMPEYNQTIDATNFVSTTQNIVEREYDKTENKPKAFIGDLAPKLIEKSLHQSPELFFSMADHLNKGLSQKDIQLYFTDDIVEKAVLQKGWGGDVKIADKDYLMVVNTNLGGGKTDGSMEELVDVTVNIAADGTISNTVKITRTNNGDPLNPDSGVNNVNYVRLYVPRGSTLTHADGFTIPNADLFDTPDPSWIVDNDLRFSDTNYKIDKESGTQIYEEAGKTVFGNWTQTKPGHSSITTFTYTLPFTFSDLMTQQTRTEKFTSWLGFEKTDVYSLLIQKQSGILHRRTSISVHVPETLTSLWSSSDLSLTRFGNNTDHLLSTLLTPSL